MAFWCLKSKLKKDGRLQIELLWFTYRPSFQAFRRSTRFCPRTFFYPRQPNNGPNPDIDKNIVSGFPISWWFLVIARASLNLATTRNLRVDDACISDVIYLLRCHFSLALFSGFLHRFYGHDILSARLDICGLRKSQPKNEWYMYMYCEYCFQVAVILPNGGKIVKHIIEIVR